MDQTTIDKLINLVRDAAPTLWEAARQNVMAQTIQCIIWFVMGAIGLVVLWRTWRAIWVSMKKKEKESFSDTTWQEVGLTLVGIGMLSCLIDCIVSLNSIVYYVLSPNYAAIQALMNLVK